MFNTMTVTKTAAALIGSLLFLMLASWFASSLYHVGYTGHVAEGEEIPQAYRIPVEDSSGGGEEEVVEEGPDLATLLASADPALGERAFGKCRSCHKLDGTDGVGPHLNGVVGRDKAAVDGFNYSTAALEQEGAWEPENIDAFVTNPREYMPGTKMAFAGIKNAEERANLIAYLQTTN
ncbi:cytochrome c family protein [Paracoccus sp. MC1862]|uniref:c-type cytochrome n=1 Tax=Paracoccus sp. MC1862 TaxID=2760307 RepID=UPI00160217C2|nr:cytochrome c family protein [Paracoccus sp. MC1862]MBB1496857.1 cytochrome c family protein [Paracoccus sp. MC1862]QQO45484.1 cytochrome c family protein [Paracoccus sp. MC1862]